MLDIPNVQKNIPLAQYTTFKIGGPAKYFVVAESAQELNNAVHAANAANMKWYVLGGGSDVLVSDAGFDGLVIKTHMRGIEIDSQAGTIRAEAGLAIAGLIAQSVKNGLAGMEYAIGVPASVGGAVWANLGARGSEIADFVVEARVMDEQGNVKTLSKEECAFSYRHSIFKDKQWIVLDVLLQLEPMQTEEDQAALKERVRELSQLRNKTQDITAQCAGCIFMNPTDQTTEAAAKLIDDLGLKGFSIGGAQVSERHANFIINTGKATADDVVQLISYIKQQVRDKKGIQLMEEVEYVGF